MKVCILGCGPAGLLAAHAVALYGDEPVIFSRKVPSRISGAQYLHRPIPQVTDPGWDGQVEFIKLGTREEYAWKVYGDHRAETSWDQYNEGVYNIWSMQEAYETLWTFYHASITDRELRAEDIDRIMLSDEFDLVISSIDARALCYDPGHDFTFQTVTIADYTFAQDQQIVMDGLHAHRHYRSSLIFGHGSAEYAIHDPAHLRGHILRKPLHTDCNCWGEILRVGRYGTWQKKTLAHEAFETTEKVLGEMHNM